MKKHYPLLLFAAVILIFTTCKKEVSREGGTSGGNNDDGTNPGDTTTNNNSNNNEVGEWKFISLYTVITQDTSYTEASNAVKKVMTTDFTSENNNGTVKFDGATLTNSGVAYTFSAFAKTLNYVNGAVIDTVISPITGTVTPQNVSIGYTKRGADSIYFQTGRVMDVAGSVGYLPFGPTTYKLLFNGTSLSMILSYDAVISTVSMGVTKKITTHVAMVYTLQKI